MGFFCLFPLLGNEKLERRFAQLYLGFGPREEPNIKGANAPSLEMGAGPRGGALSAIPTEMIKRLRYFFKRLLFWTHGG